MKKRISIIAISLILSLISLGQSKSSFKYQAALRNSDGSIIQDETVIVRMSILEESATGTIIYTEDHITTTNSYGLIALNIGEGEIVTGYFNSINWGENQFYLKTEINVNNDGFVEMGISPLVSVPYALHAETVTNNNDADADPSNEIQDLILEGSTLKITNNQSATEINLAPFQGNNTDEQTLTIEDANLSIENGNTVDLSIIQDGTVDADADTLNEIQDLVLTGSTLKITKNENSTDINLSPFLGENTDEQYLTLTETQLSISNGNSIDLSVLPDSVIDDDADPTNELQTISIVGDTIKLDKNGGNVTLPAKGWGGVTDEALFAVVNSRGDTVFAVYEGGVQIYVNDSKSKAARNGFAVASRSAAKGTTEDILTVTKESFNIILDTVNSKGARNGFAVASRSAAKGEAVDLLNVTNDSVRFYIDGSDNSKAARNGFAVASRSAAKGTTEEILTITNESFNIVLDSAKTKGARNGFAVASRSAAKSGTLDILNVTEDSVTIYIKESKSKAARNGFAVASRSAAKNTTTDILNLTKDSTRLYVANSEAGFSVQNTESGSAYSLMKLTENNYFIGHQAGSNNNTGLYNTFLGYQSGTVHETGNNNIYIGYQSAYSDSSGQNNIFIGHKTGYNNITGSENLFIGDSSGYNNTTGNGHVFLGYNAGVKNTTGVENTFVGYKSGQNTTSGYANAFFGTLSGLHNTTGFANVFIGPYAGHFNTTGRENVFIGLHCGQNNTEGYYNTFVGKTSGAYNTTGIVNTFLGFDAGLHNTSGDGNTFLGASTGNFNSTGSNNTFVGNGAGASPGGSQVSTASANVFIGAMAGFNAVGDSNVFIGNYAGHNATGSNLLYVDNSETDKPLIYGNFTDGSERVEINGNFVVNQDFWVAGTSGGNHGWNDFSDERLKKNITTLPNALSRVKQLRGVNFEWKDTEKFDYGLQMGFVAQEALEVIPEVVNKNGEFYSMQYASITAILVEALKEQQEIIESQKNEINSLKEKVNRIDELDKQIQELKELIK